MWARSFYEGFAPSQGRIRQLQGLIDDARADGKAVMIVRLPWRDAYVDEVLRIMEADKVEPGWMALDIGPRSISLFNQKVRGAGTVIWNGPVGVAEIKDFGDGTKAVGEAIAASGAYTLVGGGDTVAAIESLGLAGRFSHVSTGGGATLEYLEGKELPGIAILKEA